MLVYGLSARDEITFTSDGWDDHALAHGGVTALSHRVAGRPLWDFVAGDATRDFYRTHFRTCRDTGESLTVILRLDSPAEERLFCQRIVPHENGALRLESHLIRARPLPAVIPVAFKGLRDLLRCSICLSGSTGGRWWIEAARLTSTRGMTVTWDVCPDCRAGAVARGPVVPPPLPA